MSIERIGVGPRMSDSVVHGNTVYFAGKVASKTLDSGVKDQTAEILAILDAAMATAGTDKTKVLSATIYLSDISTFAEMNSVWDAWVVPGQTPARATVEAKLAAPKCKVEISLIAAR